MPAAIVRGLNFSHCMLVSWEAPGGQGGSWKQITVGRVMRHFSAPALETGSLGFQGALAGLEMAACGILPSVHALHISDPWDQTFRVHSLGPEAIFLSAICLSVCLSGLLASSVSL